VGFLRSRVTLGIAGFIVFGVLGALAVTTPLHFGTNTTANIQGTSTTVPPTSQSSHVTATASPRVEPTVAVTPTPLPTESISPTNTPSNSPTILRGNIGALGSNSFTLNESTGGSITVVVNSNTQYQNVSGFSSLRTGMSSTITGKLLPGGDLLATIVHIHLDN
jgi:hypothetical protein